MNMRKTAPAPADLQTRAARLSSIDKAARTFDVVWTTGSMVRRYSWMRDEEFDEELVVDPGAMRLERLNGGAPFLESHRSYALSGVLGVVVDGSVRIKGGKGYATIRMSEREEVEPVWRDIKAGIIRHVSAGYRVHKFERTAKADRKDGGERALYRAIDWEPLEISAVAIGADAAAQIRGDQRGATPLIIERNNDMPTQVAAPVAGAEIPARVRALAEGDGIATGEMIDSRAPVLRALGDLAERHQMTEAELRRGINAALAAPDDAAGDRAMRGAVLDILAERDAATLGGTREPALGVRVGESWDSPAAQRAKLSDARAAQVCEALGLRHEPTAGRELAGLDAVAQARWLAGQRGERGLRSDRQALDWFARNGAGSHGTSDFPAVASGTVEVVVARSIEQAPIALLLCTTRIPASDWRARRHVDFSSASRLRDQMEAAELQYGTIDETGEPLAPPKRKALGVKLTHEAIRNAVSHGVQLDIRLARAMIEAANEAARSTIGAKIIDPGALEDGLSPFHASRGTDGGDLVLGVDQLGVAQSALSRLTDTQGTPRPVPLDILLVAPEQHTAAEKLVAELSPAQVDQANPFARRIRVMSDPELPAGAWYALPSPAAYDGLALITMDDMPTPRIESREAWNTFATEWRLQWPMAASWLKPVWFRATVPSE